MALERLVAARGADGGGFVGQGDAGAEGEFVDCGEHVGHGVGPGDVVGADGVDGDVGGEVFVCDGVGVVEADPRTDGGDVCLGCVLVCEGEPEAAESGRVVCKRC